jgi:hypothetical protein
VKWKGPIGEIFKKADAQFVAKVRSFEAGGEEAQGLGSQSGETFVARQPNDIQASTEPEKRRRTPSRNRSPRRA